MANVEVKLKRNLTDDKIFEGVEYIEGTGTQWIQLDAEIDYNVSNLYIDFQYTDINTIGYLYCAVRDDDGLYAQRDYIVKDYTSGDGSFIGYDYGRQSESFNFTNTNRCVITRNSNGLYVDGTLTKSRNDRTYIANGTTTLPVAIFNISEGKYSNEYVNPNLAHMKLYQFKYGNASEWKVNLLPCVRKSDQVAGLYDVINHRFYTNAGAGTFVIGSKTGATYDNDTYAINKFNGLKSVESLSQSTPDPKSINYGVIASSGSLEVVDANGEIADMIQNGEIENSDVPMEIKVNGNNVRNLISDNTEYDTVAKTLSISYKSTLDSWNNIYYGGFGVKTASMTLYQILLSVFDSTLGLTSLEVDEMLGSYKSLLNTISKRVPYPYLPAGTLRETIDKICVLGQLCVIEDDDGNIRFKLARPIKEQDTNIVVIPTRYQFAPLSSDLIIKNKYKNVNVESYNTVVDIDKNATGYSHSISPYEDFDPRSWGYGLPATVVTAPILSSSPTVVARVEAGYHTGSFSFEFGDSLPGQANFISLITALKENSTFEINMNTVPNMYDKNDYVTIETNQILYSYSGTDTASSAAIVTAEFNEFADQYNDYYQNQIPLTYTKTDNIVRNFGGSISATITGGGNTATASLPDESYINLSLSGNTVTCNYKILTRKTELGAVKISQFILNRVINEYAANKITLGILGTKITVDFTSNNETQQSTDNNTFNLQTNELCQTSTLANTIKQNILSDYNDGIKTISTTVSCADYYDSNDNKVKDWSQGDVLEVGDIVRIDKDNKGLENAVIDKDSNDVFFKITGRHFRYSGVPILDLELQEIKSGERIEFNYTPITENGETVAYAIGTSGQSDSAMTNFDSKFTQITIPETYNGLPVTTILAQAFNGNYPTLNIKPNIISIGFATDANRQFNIINYNGRVPVTENGSYVDNGLEAKVININKDVEELGDNLFCHQLYTGTLETKINFEPNSKCKTIGRYTFKFLTITALNLPSSLETISGNAFSGCHFDNLPNFRIPKSVKDIKGSAFYDTDGFTNIVFEHSNTDVITLGSKIFSSKTARTATVYTDNETIKNYDWAGDNLTVTLLHLDGSAWES